jgi:hypothetical protein
VGHVIIYLLSKRKGNIFLQEILQSLNSVLQGQTIALMLLFYPYIFTPSFLILFSIEKFSAL